MCESFPDYDAYSHTCRLSLLLSCLFFFLGTRRVVNLAFSGLVLAWLEQFFATDIFLQHSLGFLHYIE
jgi:hypothetical protein